MVITVYGNYNLLELYMEVSSSKMVLDPIGFPIVSRQFWMRGYPHDVGNLHMLSADCLRLVDGDTQDGPGSASSKFFASCRVNIGVHKNVKRDVKNKWFL